jgi:hypothetical protein
MRCASTTFAPINAKVVRAWGDESLQQTSLCCTGDGLDEAEFGDCTPGSSLTKKEMRKLGYPSTRGELYCCLFPIQSVDASSWDKGALANAARQSW